MKLVDADALKAEYAQKLFDAILSDGPAGANPENQQFPEGFHEWSRAKRERWAEEVARATYMAQCSHLDQIKASVDSILGEMIVRASQPLREMIRRLADELSNATDPIVSLCLDKEECRSLVYQARALLKESDHA